MTVSLDVANRTVSAASGSGTEYYAYGPSNERVWKREEFTGGGSLNYVYFYGVDGALLTTGCIDDDWDYNVYFAGRQVWREYSGGSPRAVSPDRLGSAVKHFPYGDEPTTTTQDRVKFATYYRDETTALDYARNRYYSSTIARFTTADPYGGSARPGAPQTWNRYAYVGGDPVNFNDPSGLDPDDPGTWIFGLPYRNPVCTVSRWGEYRDTTICFGGLSGAAVRIRFTERNQRMWDMFAQQTAFGSGLLSDKIDQMAGSNCEKVLGENGKSLDDLRSVLNDTSFMRANGQETGLWLQDALGDPTMPAGTIRSQITSEEMTSFAFVLGVPAGGGTVIPNLILVGASLTLMMDGSQQQNTLLGELLHIVFQKDDQDILSTFGITPAAGQSPSSAFHDWVDGDCGAKP